jgi:hypothetical protein
MSQSRLIVLALLLFYSNLKQFDGGSIKSRNMQLFQVLYMKFMLCTFCFLNKTSLFLLGDWTEHFGIYPYRKSTNASNDHFIVMSSQMLLHVSAYQRHHQGPHMILRSYLYVGVHYKKNNGVPNNRASVSIVTLWK